MDDDLKGLKEAVKAELARLTAAGIDVHQTEFHDRTSALEHARKLLRFNLITQDNFDRIVRAMWTNVIPLRRSTY
jgi:hypothetical protein